MNRRFLRSLHEEHLEEISALYERRLAYLDDTEISLEDLEHIEGRMEAHLDALIVGAEAAQALCEERAEQGDVGELFGAVCVSCRVGGDAVVEAALKRVEEQDEDADGPTPSDALADALRFEAPGTWHPHYDRMLAHTHPAVRAAVAPMAADRQRPLGAALFEAASSEQEGASTTVLLAGLGRLRERSATTVLAEHAQRTDIGQATAALVALLRFGDPAIVTYIAGRLPTLPSAAPLLAIAGGPAHAPIFKSQLGRPEVTEAEVIAAGLFGDMSALPPLLACLEREHHPDAVAQALYLLTGAPVYETVLEDAQEIEAPQSVGPEAEPEPPPELESPDPRDQVEVVRLSHSADQWRQWCDSHANAFAPRKRYRLGQLVSPAVLGHTLSCFVLRRAVRQLAAEEIGLRYWPKVDFDVDMRVSRLRAAQAALPSLRNSDAILSRADGAWVFARALLR